MTNLKRWVQVGQADFMKWTDKGQAVEGHWIGTTPGKFGDLGIVETAEGRVSFPIHTALVDKLKRIREGAEIRIEYLGKELSKGGREFKNFFVGVGSAEDVLPVMAEDDEKEVPF